MGGYHGEKTCIETIRNLLEKADYESRSKKRKQDFSRNRKMPFKKLMWFTLSLVKESSQNALERFFPKIKEAIHMRQQAFSLARQKVKWEAFRELFQASVQGSYNETIKEWRGYLLLAIDSSHIALPRDAALREYYGAAGHELQAATARASLLYDIANDIIVDARIEPLTVDERSLAKAHLEALGGMGLNGGKRQVIVICDHGYPSKDFIKYLQDKEIKYVMRVQRRFNPRIDRMRSGSKVIRISEGIQARVIVFRLVGGEREAMITNLEEGELEAAAFPELYYKRWPIETKYNQLKQKFELENFSGRLVDNIRQDFYAMMTVSNMLSSSLREANETMPKGTAKKKRRYEYRANVNHAVGVLKDRLIGILITDDSLARKYLYQELVSEIRRRIVPVRPNREVARKENLKKPHFHHNHKSNC
ncbi:MAG: IS4 family transposase [Treponema sp.]|jgi:hypothetical protein|nr:IS4 family transposase [Treponema sp.]